MTQATSSKQQETYNLSSIIECAIRTRAPILLKQAQQDRQNYRNKQRNYGGYGGNRYKR